MLVYLLRHGRAVNLGGGVRTDEQRHLTQAGIAHLETAIRSYKADLPRPDRILHSPYVRARQSAEILARELGFEGALEPTPILLSEADPEPVLHELQVAARGDTRAIALVSHEPLIGRVLGTLLTGGTPASVPMDVGMMAVVRMDAGSLWGRLLLVK